MAAATFDGQERKVHPNDAARSILIRGARTHNLKNIDVDIPKGRLTVICGPSGSGKTSLAFDTLYLEGQRRYIESLSARLRQHFDELPRPDVDMVANLAPTVAVGGQPVPRGGRDSLAKLTEIFEFLKLIFAKIGRVFCTRCHCPAPYWTVNSLLSALSGRAFAGHRVMIAFRCEEWSTSTEADFQEGILRRLRQQGWSRIIHAGLILPIDEVLEVVGQPKGRPGQHPSLFPSDRTTVGLPTDQPLFVVVDRIQLGSTGQARLREALEVAFTQNSRGCAVFLKPEETDEKEVNSPAGQFLPGDGETIHWEHVLLAEETWLQAEFFSRPVCPKCRREFLVPSPNLFDWQTAAGACPRCRGTGTVWTPRLEKVFPNPRLSLSKGAFVPFEGPAFRRLREGFLTFAQEVGIPLDRPVEKLPQEALEKLMQGEPGHSFPGIVEVFRTLERQRHRHHVRAWFTRFTEEVVCPTCLGARLREEALAVFLETQGAGSIGGVPPSEKDSKQDAPSFEMATRRLNIHEFLSLPLDKACEFLKHLSLPVDLDPQVRVGLQTIQTRLECLQALSLGYLTLDRAVDSLSTGEFRRALLSRAISSSLSRVIYVLDEPSTGLHARDRQVLRDTIYRLRDRGNTVVVVEHDETLIRTADWIIELGPGAGERGGEVVFSGRPDALQKAASLTAQYLFAKSRKPLERTRRQADGWIKLVGACGNNLKNIAVEFPLGVLCVVSGVSGAGKSSLVEKTLYPALCQRLYGAGPTPLPFADLMGERQIGDVVLVDQTAPGKTTRSNPATFLKVFDEIRKVFAATSEAKIRGFRVGHFSFNSPEGWCPRCEGEGTLEVDMVFLPNMELPCPECAGSRYRPEVLQVSYRGKTIAEVLQMTVREAYFFFRGEPRIQSRLKRLMEVGLDYLRLGQPIKTLSGGESQRLRLASYFTQSRKRPTLFILNEPTSGLHPHDIRQLVESLETLLSLGHTLLVIEHHLELIALADYVIDLGPGAGDSGGRVVAQGTPREIAECEESVTGAFLRKMLDGDAP